MPQNNLLSIPILPRVILEDFSSKLRNFPHQCKKVSLPKEITPRLAYFMGYLHSDGCLESNQKRLCFSDEHFQHLEEFNELIKEIFGINGKIRARLTNRSTKESYILELHSTIISNFIHLVFGMEYGSKENIFIPSIIQGNNFLLRWYLAGLYDGDGTLPICPNTVKVLFIDISLKNKRIIEQVKDALSKFGIATLKLYARKSDSSHTGKECITWELRIRKRYDLKRFLEIIGFCHCKKSTRAEKMIKLLK